MRIAPLAAVVAALACLLAAAPAGAKVTTRKAMWGPAEVNGVSQFPVYAQLGVGIWQTTISWRDIATRRPADPTDPDDPAYAWPTATEAQIKQAARYGITVLISVAGTPGWANGGGDWNVAPENPADFGAFMAAASRHFPAVHRWLIWGEPSREANFSPTGKAGARLYARMLDSAYVHLKRVTRRNLVIGGNSYTIGDVRPLDWIRLLRLPNGKPPRMDYYGHNPFTGRTPRLSQPPLGHGYADFGDLDTLARQIDRYLGRRPGGAKIPIFISELCLPTDHANWEFNIFLTRKKQAQWLTDALKVSRSWPRIVTLGYLSLYDPPVRPANDQAEVGLITREGVRKPAFKAFRDG
jgi:hypothetical protein